MAALHSRLWLSWLGPRACSASELRGLDGQGHGGLWWPAAWGSCVPWSWPEGRRAPAQDGSPRQPLLRWVLPKTCWWEVLGEQIHPLMMWGLHTALGQA